MEEESVGCTMPRPQSLTQGMTNLVASGVSQTGEERGELAADGGGGVLLEDDLLEFGCGGDLEESQSATIASHASAIESDLTLVWLLIKRFAVVSTWWRLSVPKDNDCQGNWFVRDGRPSARRYQHCLVTS